MRFQAGLRDNRSGVRMPVSSQNPTPQPEAVLAGDIWLRRHAEYQRVYKEGKRQSLPLMTYFFAGRPLQAENKPAGLRVGLTAGRVLGNAVTRNRIKRRMRAAVRNQLQALSGPPMSMDLVLHPRQTVFDAPFPAIERDVARALQAVLNPATKPTTAVSTNVPRKV